MKHLLLCIGLSVASITELNVTNNDTMFVNTYYNDGTLKMRGIKVHKLKQGEWYYYNTNGFPFKIEKYKNDKIVSSIDLTALRGAK